MAPRTSKSTGSAISSLCVFRVLAAAEQNLAKLPPAENGRDLLKRVRSHLIETTRPVMEAMVEEVTGVQVVTMHLDISTQTGEEVILFTLARSPDFREAKMKMEQDYE